MNRYLGRSEQDSNLRGETPNRLAIYRLNHSAIAAKLKEVQGTVIVNDNVTYNSWFAVRSFV